MSSNQSGSLGSDVSALDLSVEYFRREYPAIPIEQSERFAKEMLDPVRAGEGLKVVGSFISSGLDGLRLLEVGCGVGATVFVSRQEGIRAYGVEPSHLGCLAANARLREARIPEVVCQARGEALPFADGSFDVVCSFQVLEHTQDPVRVLAESVRVLRNGGTFVHIFPNYGSLWEGHYGVPWIPHMSKKLARWYIKSLGRDTRMLDDLQLLSYQSVRKMTRSLHDVYIRDWGFDLWESRVRTMQFSEWGYLGRLKAAVRFAHRLGVIELVIMVGKRLHWETPIVLVGVKR